MAATVSWCEFNGASATETVGISNVNFGNHDSVNIVPASYPIRRGQNSYDKWLKMKFAGTFNKVYNFKLWRSDSGGGEGAAMPTGISMVGEVGTGSNLSYAAPSTTSIGTYSVPNTEVSAFSVGPTAGLTGAGYAYYMHLQLKTTVDAATGDTPVWYLTFQYDEE
jgi:hypothetical protein